MAIEITQRLLRRLDVGVAPGQPNVRAHPRHRAFQLADVLGDATCDPAHWRLRDALSIVHRILGPRQHLKTKRVDVLKYSPFVTCYDSDNVLSGGKHSGDAERQLGAAGP